MALYYGRYELRACERVVGAVSTCMRCWSYVYILSPGMARSEAAGSPFCSLFPNGRLGMGLEPAPAPSKGHCGAQSRKPNHGNGGRHGGRSTKVGDG